MSLTVTPATNAAAMPMEAHRDEDASEPSSSAILTHDSFLLALDAELKKLDAFAHGQVGRMTQPSSSRRRSKLKAQSRSGIELWEPLLYDRWPASGTTASGGRKRPYKEEKNRDVFRR